MSEATAAKPVANLPKLTATVKHDEGKGRAKVVSKVNIWLGDLAVASAVLGGKYNPEQALREFDRFPGKFTRHGGYASAALVGLCPA